MLIVCLLPSYGGVLQHSFYGNGHASYGHVHALYGCDEHFFYGDSYFFSISKHLKKIKIKMTWIALGVRNWCEQFKGGSRHRDCCMARALSFLIRYFSNYYTLHRSDLAARAAPLDPCLAWMFLQHTQIWFDWLIDTWHVQTTKNKLKNIYKFN